MKSTSHSNIKQDCRKRNSTVKLIPLSQRIGGTQNCLIQPKILHVPVDGQKSGSASKAYRFGSAFSILTKCKAKLYFFQKISIYFTVQTIEIYNTYDADDKDTTM
jgi:hypothetical protein